MDSGHPRTRARREAHPCEDPIAEGCLQFSLSGPTQWAWFPSACCCARLHPGKQIRHVRIRNRLLRLILQECKLLKGAEGGALQVGRTPPLTLHILQQIGEGKSLLSGDNVRALFLPSLYDKQSPALLTQPELRAIQEVARELVPARPHGLFNDSNVVATVDGDQVRRILEYKHTRLC